MIQLRKDEVPRFITEKLRPFIESVLDGITRDFFEKSDKISRLLIGITRRVVFLNPLVGLSKYISTIPLYVKLLGTLITDPICLSIQ